MSVELENQTPKFPPGAGFGLALGIASMGVCWIVIGSGIGLFFGGIIFAALLVPPLVLGEEKLTRRILVAIGVNVGIAIVWLGSVGFSSQTVSQFILCYVALFAWCLALAGLSILLRSLLRRAIPASCVAIVIGIMWLSWPIWLAQYLPEHQGLVEYLVPPHPLFLVNSVLKDQGIWSERPIAYRYLFTLGQDVPYELPRSVVPMIALHGLIGGIGLVVCGFAGGKARR